jgi:hypothetical protein
MTDELEKKQETAIAQTSRRGHEAPVDQEDLVLPRMMLVQYTPPKTVKIDESVVRPGMLINSLTAQQIPTDKDGFITIIPIRRNANWVRFNAQDKDKPGFDPAYEPGAVIWRSDNPADPKVLSESKFGPNGEPPVATKFINFFCLIPGQMPMVLSFAKTSFKAGKKLTTLTQIAEGDMFSWKYKLKAVQEQNADQQKYYVLTVEPGGKCAEEEFRAAEKLYEQFRTVEVKVHDLDDNEAAGEKKAQPWESQPQQ